MDYREWENSPEDSDDKRLLLEKAIRLVPSKAEYYYELGRYYHEKVYADNSREDWRKMLLFAGELLQKAAMLQPGNGEYLAEIAWLIGNKGEIEKSIACFETAISLDAKNAYIHSTYAVWAINYARKVIRIDDTKFLIETYNPKENLLNYEEKSIGGVPVKTFLDIAGRELNETILLGIPCNHEIYVYKNRADLFLMQGAIDESIDNYKKTDEDINLKNALQLNSDHIEARLFLAKSYDAMGILNMAINEYTKILKAKPNHNEANLLLNHALKQKFTLN